MTSHMRMVSDGLMMDAEAGLRVFMYRLRTYLDGGLRRGSYDLISRSHSLNDLKVG